MRRAAAATATANATNTKDSASFSRRVLQIAVLECEQMPPYIVQSHGNFARIFERWLQVGTHRLNAERPARREHLSVRTSSWNVKEGRYPPSFQGVDAIIISGSVNGVHDDVPWIATLRRYLLGTYFFAYLLTYLLDPLLLSSPFGVCWLMRYAGVYHDLPWIKIFGSCFGHQLIAQTLLGEHGVRVEKSDGGWEVGVQEVYHDRAFVQNFPGLSQAPVCYQFLHSDEVVARGSLPPTWSSIGSSALCEIQGLHQPGRVLTYQVRGIWFLVLSGLQHSVCYCNQPPDGFVADYIPPSKDLASLFKIH